MLNSINNLKKHSFIKNLKPKKKNKSSFFSALYSTLNNATTQFSQKFLKRFAQIVTIHGYFLFYKHRNKWRFEFRLYVERDSYLYLYLVQELLGGCGSIGKYGNGYRFKIGGKPDIIDIILPILTDNPFLTGDAKERFELFKQAILVDSDKKLSSLEKDTKINAIRTELKKIEAKTKD